MVNGCLGIIPGNIRLGLFQEQENIRGTRHQLTLVYIHIHKYIFEIWLAQASSIRNKGNSINEEWCGLSS